MSASGGILLKNSKAEADEIPRRGGPEVDDQLTHRCPLWSESGQTRVRIVG
jgi:hypothetical protein